MTRRLSLALMALLLVAVACGNQDQTEPGMGEMTPEEHARMLAGGNQGTVDTTGAAVRQAVHLTSAQERALGVVYTTVTRDSLQKSIRTVGTIQAPEPNVADVTPKVDGFVEQLFVNTTGEMVQRGQPLLSLYSPSLVAAQEEFLTAQRLVARVDSTSGEPWLSAQATLDAARRRLAYWDISAAQIADLERSGTVRKTLTLVSPVNGIVLEKAVLQGQRVVAGQWLYRIADLSEVWVEGEVFEQDLSLIHRGMPVHIEIAAIPGEHLMGRVSFIYPTVDPVSRTNRIRLTVPNPGFKLKPGMFATIFLDAVVGRNVLALPRTAVVVTGTRNIVFVRDSTGMLQPREVVLGVRSDDRVEILSGLTTGETIVASANFLVDAESRLGSTGGTMPGMQHGTTMPAPTDTGMGTMPPDSEHRHDQ